MTFAQSIHPTRVRFLVACLATVTLTLAACIGSSSSASPPSSGKRQTIHLIEHPTNVNSVSVGSPTGCTNATSCQGDYLIGENPMSDAATGREVGTITFECFFVDTGTLLLHCPGITITLINRGQIVFNESVDLGGEVRLANGTITGGTGEFIGATGTVTSRKLASTSDFVITLTREARGPSSQRAGAPGVQRVVERELSLQDRVVIGVDETEPLGDRLQAA